MLEKDEQVTEGVKIIDTTETVEIENKEEETEKAPKRKNSFFREIINYLILIIIAYGLANVVHLYIFTPVSVDGESMLNTLHNNDYVFLWRLGNLDRFDIVVFEVPDDNEDYYIKRLIGMPGDYVEVRDSQLYINGILIEEPYLDDRKADLNNPRYFTSPFTLEQICDRSNLNCNVNGRIQIPEGYYLVLGDNRMNSRDSREIGLIKRDLIIGEAKFVLYPFNHIKNL